MGRQVPLEHLVPTGMILQEWLAVGRGVGVRGVGQGVVVREGVQGELWGVRLERRLGVLQVRQLLLM